MTHVLTVASILCVGGAATAWAQTTSSPPADFFASLSVGGQPQTHTLTETTNFALYNELASVTSTQQVGSGMVFDFGGGYRLSRHFALGVGLWTFHAHGDGAVAASIPDPLVFGRSSAVSLTAADLSQTTVGVNFQAIWTANLTDTFQASFFGGPSIVHVKQDLASVNVATGTQNASAAPLSQSATTGKAGNVGVDLSYRLTERYRLGGFVRYAGGEADLPSAPNLKVGGFQVGAGVRFDF